MLDEVLQSPSLEAFAAKIRTSSVLIEHLWDTPKALLSVLAQKATNKNVLIVSGKKEDRFLQSFPFFSGEEILDLPAWETLPSEKASPGLDISGRRLQTLYEISKAKRPFFLHCSLQSLIQKTLPPESLVPLCSFIRKGREISFSGLTDLLIKLGYKRSPVASDKGEFAVRGGIVDVFPVASLDPYRIDFFGDEVDSIRTYDPIGQKSLHPVDSLFLCPVSERALLLKEKKPVTLPEYLGPNTLIVLTDLLEIEDEYVALKSLSGMQGPLFFSFEDFMKELPKFTHLLFSDHKAEELSNAVITGKQGRDFYSGKEPFETVTFDFFSVSLKASRFRHPFIEIPAFFSRFENVSAANKEEIFLGIGSRSSSPLSLKFITGNESEERMIREKLLELGSSVPQKIQFLQGYLPSGFALENPLFAYVSSVDLTKRFKVSRQPWRHSYHTEASDFHRLYPGDTIVHVLHGIGKFLGVQIQKNHLGQESEFFHIEYGDGGKLYVPINQSHLISRYIGSDDEKPIFSLLGSKKWQKTYTEAQASVLGYAKNLLENAAQRVAKEGFVFPEDSAYMQLFEEEFPFPETEDQLRAICDIKKDMSSPKAMDRLVCGDVGYGKTEVALRAAFKAAFEGKKQVAVLVPTTLLAVQHYESFKARMENFPLNIAVLSRFNSAKETKIILEKLKEGSIDIVIGTHRLVSKDISFKDLGLLIIDEEQRFGVRAKEHIKSLKTGVDCLTLSATPIPRTLYMSLVGIKEVSVISTPPQDRLPIKSIVTEKDSELIRNAIIREFARNGQVFFIHNRVETLPKVYLELQKLVPSAKIAMGHGQMDSEEIDSVFSSFKSGESDILLSTTIVENGIDIPNANTIFIDRADTFGMADLYQLRGRVGRWNRTAYAYFLTPKNTSLSELAHKRLRTLAESSGYGSGMKIALRDLELRGAGDILGTQQSGQIAAIGFHLYCKMLKKAIEAVKQSKPLELHEAKVEFSSEAKLPESYVNEPELRMEFYYRLGSASSPEEINEILKELEDRFGKAPRPVLLLCLFSRIKIRASALRITSLKFDKFTVSMEKQIAGTQVKSSFPIGSIAGDLAVFEQNIEKILKDWNPKK